MTYDNNGIGFSHLWSGTRLNCSPKEVVDRLKIANYTSETMAALFAGELSLGDKRKLKELSDWMYKITISGPHVCASLGDMVAANVKSMESSTDEEAEIELNDLTENLSSLGFRDNSGGIKQLGDILTRDMILMSGSQEEVTEFYPDHDKGRLFMIPNGELPPEDCPNNNDNPQAPPPEFHNFRHHFGNRWFTTFIGISHMRAYTKALKNVVGSNTDLKWFQASIAVSVYDIPFDADCRKWTACIGPRGSNHAEY